MSTAEHRFRDYGNWRRPQSRGLWELGTAGTAALIGSFVVMMILFLFAGIPVAVGWMLIAGLVLLGMSRKNSHGQSYFERTAPRLAHRRLRSRNEHQYRSGPLGATPWGTCQLPGISAGTRLREGYEAFGSTFSLLQIKVPGTQHYSITFQAQPDGEALVDDSQIDLWVSHWGQFLAELGTESGVVAATVTVESAPDTGEGVHDEVEANIDPSSAQLAQDTLRELAAMAPIGSASIRAWVTLTFEVVAPQGKSVSAEEMARLLAMRVPGIQQALAATGAGDARPSTAQDLCEIVRVAYDPAAGPLITKEKQAGRIPELHWSDVGPVSHINEWDRYHHDGAVSVSWIMTGAPRGTHPATVLKRVLGPHPDVDRKRVAIIYRPIDHARAAEIVEADKRDAYFLATSQAKPSARSMDEVKAAEQTAQEESRGAGLVNFGMIVTATVEDERALPDAVHAVQDLCKGARLNMRRAYGFQDTAFAAALPLGLVLPAHTALPEKYRRYL